MKRAWKRCLSILLVITILSSLLVMPAAAAAQYTVSVSDGIAGTATVKPGDTVEMKVTVSGAAFNGLQAAVSYDNNLFELTSAKGSAVADDSQTKGVVELYTLRNAAYAAGSKVAELTFVAKAEGTGSFGVFGATVGNYVDFKSGNAVPAKTVGDRVAVEEVFAVSGVVLDGKGNPASNVHVILKKGNEQVIEADGYTNAKGEYTLRDVHSGVYNLVAEEKSANGRTMTVMVDVHENVVVGKIRMPEANVSSELNVEAGTPAVVVGGLEKVAAEYGNEASERVQVTVSMTVAETEDLTDNDSADPKIQKIKAAQEAIKNDASGDEAEFTFYEIDLTKTTTDNSEAKTIAQTNNLLEIIIPFETAGKTDFNVYRYHAGQVNVLTETANTYGERIEVEDDQITIHAKFFSTYAISFSASDSYRVTQTPAAVYWGFDSVKHGETYYFGVEEGYHAAYAIPTVTMGGASVEVAGSGTTNTPWRITDVAGDLVIKSPEHRITFQKEDANIYLPENTTAHYGQSCTFELPSCVAATVKIGSGRAEKLTADPAGKVTIQGKDVTDDIVVTLYYSHEFSDPVYRWSDDYTKCKASRVCGKCQFEESETVKTTYKLNLDGTKTFIAVFKNAAFTRQEIKTDFGKKIAVTFRLIGDNVHSSAEKHEEYVTWIPTTTYEIELGETVYDVFAEALEDAGIRDKGAAGGYVKSIQAPDVLGGYWLGEFDNGPKSGWMYTVNRKHPSAAMTDYILEKGDTIVFHYVDDWTKEEKDFTWLEAADISPETYVKRNLDKIVTIEGEGEVEPELKINHIGKDVTFTFTPEEGWKIKNVVVDGKNKGAINTYTYKDLSINSRIKVVFVRNAELQMSFEDVSESHWFYDDVYFTVSNGLFHGTGENTFSPNASMTRSMLVTVLYRLEGQPVVTGGSTFMDVKPDQWYTDAVIWAARNGIVEGYGNNLFGTNDNVTREQIAAILYRYAAYKGYDVSGANKLTHYSDYSELSLYALNAMKWANAEGLISGRTLTTLAPKATATRAEVAAIFHRFVENIVK